MKRLVLGFVFAAVTIAPFAFHPAQAWCAPDPGTGNGGCANTCPKPIVIKGQEIIGFTCPM